ncbi:MAG: hypothetical protein AB7V18_19185 [Pyrinomonadaceae bacterium]
MRLPNLTIPAAGVASNAIELPSLDKVTLFAPAALTAVVTIQLSGDDGVTWHNAPTIAINAMVTINPALASMLRVLSAGAEAADRIFFVHGGGPNSV